MKAPYFPFFVRDWLCSRSVLSMSGDQVKAYIYLLAESWLQIPRATLPNNREELASLARVSLEKWDNIKDVVLQRFEINKMGRFFNETLMEISCKSESKQRFNNKNAKRTQNERKTNAEPETEIDNENEYELRPMNKKERRILYDDLDNNKLSISEDPKIDNIVF